MPQAIPTIYTGRNVAVPDWKSLNRDLNVSFAQAKQRKQQQDQFESLQNERATRDFLKNLDVDALKSTNIGLVQQKTNIVQGLEQGLTDMLKESKDGTPTTDNLVAAKIAMTEANQEIQGLGAQAKNWEVDKKTFADNLDIYDKNKQDVIFGWKGNQNDPYTESRLDKAYIDKSVEEVRVSRQAPLRDVNNIIVTSAIAGKEIKNKLDYDDYYFDKVIDKKTGKEKLIDNYANQVGFLKATTSKEGKKGILSEIAYDKEYNKAIAGKPQVKETYEQIALNTTGNKEDAKYVYELDQAERSGASYFYKGEEKAIKTDKAKEPKITTTRGVEKVDGKINLNKINVNPTEYQDGTTAKNYVGFGNAAVKNVEAVINNPIDKSTGNQLGNTLSASDFKNADFIGVDYSGDEEMLHFKVDFGTQNKQGKDGGDVYVYGRYPEGTQEQIEDSIREKYIEGVKKNASAWRKRKDIKLTDAELQDLDKKISRFNDRIDEGDLIPLTEKKIKDVLAPASNNDAYSKLYISKQGIQKEVKEEVQELSQEAWNTKWNNLESGETLTGLDGVEYTKK